MGNSYYALELYNWVVLGHYFFVNMSLVGDCLSVGVLIIMGGGLAVVLSFVYID